MSGVPAKLLPIIGVCFVMTLGMGMMFPTLPLLAQRLGGEPALSGALIAAFGGARLLANVPAGAASDRFGRRALMLFGLGLFVVGSIAAALSPSIITLTVSLFTMGAGSACYVTAALAAVADLSADGGRGRMMSLYQGGVQAGIVIGPAAGGLLAARLGPSAPFILQAVLAMAGGLIAALLLRDTRNMDAVPAQVSGFRQRLALMAAPQFLAVCGLMFGTYFARVAANWQVVPILAHDEFGYGPEAVGLLLTAGSISNFVALPIASRSIDRLGARLTAIAGGIAAVAGLLLLCLPAREVLLWSSVLFLGLAGSTIATAGAAYAAQVSRAPNGVTMGALRMSGDVGLVLGPLALTLLLAPLDLALRTGLLLVAILMAAIVSAFALVDIVRRSRGSAT